MLFSPACQVISIFIYCILIFTSSEVVSFNNIGIVTCAIAANLAIALHPCNAADISRGGLYVRQLIGDRAFKMAVRDGARDSACDGVRVVGHDAAYSCTSIRCELALYCAIFNFPIVVHCNTAMEMFAVRVQLVSSFVLAASAQASRPVSSWTL